MFFLWQLVQYFSNLNGDAGVGFSRAYINCDYAIAAASYDEVLGM